MSAIGLAALAVSLSACGQRGPLYLPTDPAAANRATLPDLLLPGTQRSEMTPSAPGEAPASATPDNKNNDAGTPR